VRVRTEGCDPICWQQRAEGSFIGVSGDTLLLQTETQTTPSAIPFTSLSRLEVIRGRKSNSGKGALYGFIGGAVVGAISGAVAGEQYIGDIQITTAAVVALASGLGGSVGALGGLLVGASIETDRWEEVPPDRLRLRVAQQRDGRLGIELSVAFRISWLCRSRTHIACAFATR
jgi:hypothetical protein